MKQYTKHIPNVLSTYRLVAVPFIVMSIYQSQRSVFVTLLCINLITDILDGFIARRFKFETELGARLDSLADIGTFVLAVSGMFRFESVFMTEHRLEFTLLLLLYALGNLITLLRFGRLPSLHLYSVKCSGYLQGIFLFTFFTLGYSPAYFYLMLSVSYLAYLEEIWIVSTTQVLKSNMKGILFLLITKSKKA